MPDCTDFCKSAIFVRFFVGFFVRFFQLTRAFAFQNEKQVDWLDEECDALARKGLRTLVFAAKDLTEQVCAPHRERESAIEHF